MPDLGSNVVYRRSWKDGSETAPAVEYAEGDGPRHVVMHPDGTFLLALLSLDLQIS